jgi:hypothetical protein
VVGLEPPCSSDGVGWVGSIGDLGLLGKISCVLCCLLACDEIHACMARVDVLLLIGLGLV